MPNDIQSRLEEEGVMVALWTLIRKFISTGSVADFRPIRSYRMSFVDDCMALDPKLSITRLYRRFKEEKPQLPVSESTIKRMRNELSWVAKKTWYCALPKTSSLGWSGARG